MIMEGGVAMADQENIKAIIDGLRCAAGDPMPCAKCHYRAYIYNICKCKCAEDAIALLKKQEPRVLRLEEVEDALGTVVWVDRPQIDNSSDEYALISAYLHELGWVYLRFVGADTSRWTYEQYGKTWRCWDKRPTDEQRGAVVWDD